MFDYNTNLDALPYLSINRSPNSISKILDIRVDSKYSYKDWSVVARPRFVMNSTNDQNTKDRFNFTEATLSHLPNGSFSFTVGKQNFEWGPAEFVSWSNSLVHLNHSAKSFFYKQEGIYLDRLNYAPTKNFTATFLYEVGNKNLKNDYEDFTKNLEYKNKSLLKAEYTFEESAHYVGATIATGEASSYHAGIYGAYYLRDFISIYTDSKITIDQSYYEINNWTLIKSNKKNLNYLIGTRVEFTNSDFRFEYSHQDIGLTKNEFKKALYTSLAMGKSDYFLKSGRDILGKDYFYASLRLPNLSSKNDLTVYLRYLLSMQDYSQSLQTYFEKNYNDHTVLYIEMEKTLGSSTDELKISSSFNGQIGGKWSY